VPYVSPAAIAPTRHGERGPHPRWGSPCAPARSFPFELVHAHNAVPAGDAVRRVRAHLRSLEVPLIVSVHGGDVLLHGRPRQQAAAPRRWRAGSAPRGLVLANSQGIAELSRAHGAGETRVVHLGAELRRRPRAPRREGERPKPRHGRAPGRAQAPRRCPARAGRALPARHPTLRYAIIGEGPERVALEGLATRLGIAERVEFHGQLDPAQAIEQARRARCS
jgi:teichuronic acid biosynthesis glycosyltransferase TuaC